MRVFISWSGRRSNRMAEAIRDWLPAVIQAARPYFSQEDIAKGARWSADVAKELQDSKIGILCVTNDNLEAPWLMFEAGALAKSLDSAFVIPLLLDVEPSSLVGPLAQFQAARLEREDMLRVVRLINRQLGTSALAEGVLESVFDKWWPDLHEQVSKVRDLQNTDQTAQRRSDREILEEVLGHVRDLAYKRGNSQLTLLNPAVLFPQPVERLDLTMRTLSLLKAEGIDTIADLLSWSETRLLKTPNFGRKSLNEVKQILADYGMALMADSDDDL